MRRNTKFLMLLVLLLSSVTMAYFITGCGDDSTIIEAPAEVVDYVTGTVQGQIQDSWNGALLSGVKVYWTHQGVADSTTTDAQGQFSTGPTLSSGDYDFTFVYNGYATALAIGIIQTPAVIRGNNPDVPVGEMFDEDVVDVEMYPLTAGLTGHIYEALPTGMPGKDNGNGMASDANPANAVPDVLVTLDFSDYNIIPNKYTANSGPGGFYEFIDLPAAPNDSAGGQAVKLTTAAFTSVSSGQAYGSTIYSAYSGPANVVSLTGGGTTAMANIYAPIEGEDQLDLNPAPAVMTYNWQGGDFGIQDTLVMTFSATMDPDNTTVTLKNGALAAGVPGGAAVTHTKWWATDFLTLYVLPVQPMATNANYSIGIAGQSADGLTLMDNDGSDDFNRNIFLQAGIQYLTSNVVNLGSAVTNFPLADDIVLTFDMAIDETNANHSIILKKGATAIEFTATYSNGNMTVTINPDENLESNSTYTLEFDFYSALPGDFVNETALTGGAFTFNTYDNSVIPVKVTGFALDHASTWRADYNTAAINFKWNGVDDATHYEIYAKNTKTNGVANYIVVKAAIANQDHLTMQAATVNFVADDDFDIYTDDDPLVTPFAAGTDIFFKCRAYNSAGKGPWSDSVKVEDTTPPQTVAFTAQAKSADATASDSAYNVGITFADMEYLQSVTYSFSEGGGDPAVVPVAGDVSTVMDNDMMNFACTLAVAATECATGDTMFVTVTDNSGNDTTINFRLRPYIEFYGPVDTTSNFYSDFGGSPYEIKWDIMSPTAGGTFAGGLDLFWSYDGTTTWADSSVGPWEADADGANAGVGNGTAFPFVDTSDVVMSETARIGLRDENGGFIYYSDVFKWGGLKLTVSTADSTTLVDSTHYDAGGTVEDSVLITFQSLLMDSVHVTYGEAQNARNRQDTLYIATPGTITTTSFWWTPPDANDGSGYNCWLGLKNAAVNHAQNGLPRDSLPYLFPVTHDIVTFATPVGAEDVPGGAAYATAAGGEDGITWTHVGPADALVDLWYVPDGTTNAAWEDWGDSILIASGVTASDLEYSTWTPPAADGATNKAKIYMLDANGDSLAATAAFVVSGYVFDAQPVDLLHGTADDIDYSPHGTPGTCEIWYSVDGFVADSTKIGTGQAQAGDFTWSAAIQQADATECAPCSTAQIRIWGNTDDVYSTSDEFMYMGYKVTAPDASYDATVEGNVTMTWETWGISTATNVDLAYTVNGGTAWTVITTNIANTGTYSWPVSNNYANYTDELQLRVYKTGDIPSADESDTCEVSAIQITLPADAEVVDKSDVAADPDGLYDITWTVFGKAVWANLYWEYSSNNGTSWAAVAGAGSVAPGSGTGNTQTWDVAAIANTATYILRCREVTGSVWYVSDGNFTVQD